MIQRRFSTIEIATTGFTDEVVLTHADLTETVANTAQTIQILTTSIGDVVERVALSLQTPFEDSADTAFNTNLVTLGDGNDVDRFLPATEINDNATEVTYASGPGVVQIVAIPITLAGITGTGDVVTAYTPGFRFRIEALDFQIQTVVTTGSKAVSLNAEIGTTNVTGGVVALTSANCTPAGAQVAGSAITAANEGGATETISIEAASVTAFAEGSGVLLIKLRNLDAAGAGFAYTAADTVDLVVNAMAGKSLVDLDTGKLVVFLRVNRLATESAAAVA